MSGNVGIGPPARRLPLSSRQRQSNESKPHERNDAQGHDPSNEFAVMSHVRGRRLAAERLFSVKQLALYIERQANAAASRLQLAL